MGEDLEALESVKRGEEDGLRSLMDRHREALFRLAFRYTGNHTDAVDIAQETFVRAYFSADRFKPRAKVKTWLFSIAANLCRDYLRRRRRNRGDRSLEAGKDEDDTIPLAERIAQPAPEVLEEVEGREAVRAIEKAIQNLADKLRFPFVYCVLEGNSYEACAAILGCSVKAVDSRVYRARRKLQDSLRDSV